MNIYCRFVSDGRFSCIVTWLTKQSGRSRGRGLFVATFALNLPWQWLIWLKIKLAERPSAKVMFHSRQFFFCSRVSRWLNIQTWHFSVVRSAQFFPGPPAHIIHVYACYRDSNWVWTRRWMVPPSSFRGWLGFLIWAPAAAHHLITDGNMWAEGLELRTAACHLLESTCSLSLLLILGKYGLRHISTI